MKNSKALQLILLLVCIGVSHAAEICQANQSLDQFYKFNVQTSMIKEENKVKTNQQINWHYVFNYPLELISKTLPTNLNSIASIQKIDSTSQQSAINYRVQLIKRDTALLLSLAVNVDNWRDCWINILIFNGLTYPNIAFGQSAFTNLEGRLSVSSSIALPTSLDRTSLKSLVFLNGAKATLKNVDNFNLEIQLIDSIDLSSRQLKISASAGENTILSQVYVSYLIFGNSQNYEIGGSYLTFSEIGVSSYTQYFDLKVTSLKYFLAGINSLQLKKGLSAFSFSLSLQSNSQNILQLTSQQPISILKIAVFNIGNLANKICSNCKNQPIAQYVGGYLQCGNICLSGTLINGSKCLTCPTELNLTLNGESCGCQANFTLKNGKCAPQTTSSVTTEDFLPTFSTSSLDCSQPNTYSSYGVCICIPGYQKNGTQCSPICTSGYFDGSQCIGCPSGTYPWISQKVCLSCGQYCLSCRSQFACSTCQNGFYLNQGNTCSEICGDGQTIISECDDGNQNNGDGCSSCKIDDGWTCSFLTGTTTSVCQKKTVSVQRKSTTFSNGNLIIEFTVSPVPTRYYGQQELANIFKIKFLASAPIRTYLSQDPLNLSNFRLIAAYGGSSPTKSAIIDVQVTFPNSGSYNETITQDFLKTSTRTFARNYAWDNLN